MQKPIVLLAVVGLVSWGLYKLLQSPEKYLIKKTKYLIELSSIQAPQTQMGLLSRVSKASKYIHFDVHLKAEYQGKAYTARSLNEFRSLFSVYLSHKSTGSLNYKDLSAQLETNKKQGEVSFDGLFERDNQTITCKVLLNWLKEEKQWYVKTIQVFACSVQ